MLLALRTQVQRLRAHADSRAKPFVGSGSAPPRVAAPLAVTAVRYLRHDVAAAAAPNLDVESLLTRLRSIRRSDGHQSVVDLVQLLQLPLQLQQRVVEAVFV